MNLVVFSKGRISRNIGMNSWAPSLQHKASKSQMLVGWLLCGDFLVGLCVEIFYVCNKERSVG